MRAEMVGRMRRCCCRVVTGCPCRTSRSKRDLSRLYPRFDSHCIPQEAKVVVLHISQAVYLHMPLQPQLPPRFAVIHMTTCCEQALTNLCSASEAMFSCEHALPACISHSWALGLSCWWSPMRMRCCVEGARLASM